MKLYISNINDLNYDNYIDIKSYKNLKTGNYLYNKLINEDIINYIKNEKYLSIVIPFEIDESYDCQFLINHLRTEQEGLFDKVPVIVYLRDDDQIYDFYDNYEITKLNNIGVVFSENPSENDINRAINEFNDQALEDYIKLITSEPASTSSSHDKSNLWGPYICLKSLSLVDRGNEKYFNYALKMKVRLSEEIYYKKIIQTLEKTSTEQRLIDNLTAERRILREMLAEGNAKKILCIDDQIDDDWKDVYECIFSISKNIELKFSSNESKAKKIVNSAPDLSLILIDVRLDIDADMGKPVEELSGVRLSETIRKNHKTIPIIAATASNKSWTLEALLERGINSYWVKASPELIRTNNSGLKNVLDLYRKINSTLEWSTQTRKWQDSLYEIADSVKRTTDNTQLANRLDCKAKSLQALLFRSFSPFSSELSGGLQLNLAFLLIYSCFNELTEWVCVIKHGEKETCQWFLNDASFSPLAEKRWVSDLYGTNLQWFIHGSNKPHWDFPDPKVIEKIFKLKDMKCSEDFKKLKKVRNGLPLIHGKTDPSGSTAKTIEKVTPEQIDILVKLLVELKDHHLAVLNARISEG